jgi:glycosyltransferase involved in cell wall biosynthesis
MRSFLAFLRRARPSRRAARPGLQSFGIKKQGIIAMVWAPHEARTALFAQQLQAPLFNIHYLYYKRPLIAPFKYLLQAVKTWLVLAQQRPAHIYVTNPPVFAALCVFLYCLVTRAAYIMDTHPPALYSRKWAWSVPLQRLLIRYALVNIIDQSRYQILFESWGGKTVVLQRPPKTVSINGFTAEPDPEFFDIVVVNTFAADEPLDIILEAAMQLPTDRFFVLGDTKHASPKLLQQAPPNVIFTGYLLGDAYWQQLAQSRAVMVLTTYPYSLLGGAQDGVAAQKPLLLSKQPALEEFFTKGTVFVENSAESIIEGVQQLQQHEQRLAKEVAVLGDEHRSQWEANFQQLMAYVQQSGVSVV